MSRPKSEAERMPIPLEVALEYDTRDLKRMKFQDLQKVAGTLAREGRERIKELQKMEKEYGKAPALSSFERFRDSNYSARYKTREQLMNEISQTKAFLDNATSTKEGFFQYINEINTDLGYETSKEDRASYFETFRKLQEAFRNSKYFYSSDNLHDEMKEEVVKQREVNGRVNWNNVLEAINSKYGILE